MNLSKLNIYLHKLLLIISLLTAIKSYSQHPVYKQFTIADGLPSNEVYHVYQDSKGYIWFATNNGVSRYNGREFTNFGLEDGLLDLTVFEIYEDFKGRVWFIPMSARLTYYENGKINAYTNNNLIENSDLSSIGPLKFNFHIEPDETIYMSIVQSGLYKIAPEGVIEKIKVKNDSNRYNILKINNRNYIAYSGKFSNKISKNRVKNHITKDSIIFSEKLTLTKNLFRTATGFYNDKYIVSAGYLLYPLDFKNPPIIFDSEILSIQFLDSTNICIGTLKNGVYNYYLDGNKIYEKNNLFPTCAISSCCNDYEGGYWFSSLYSGAYYIPNENIKFIGTDLDKQLEYKSITSAQNAIYASIQNSNKILAYKDKSKSYLEFSDPNEYVNSLGSINDKAYVCTSLGLSVINSAKKINPIIKATTYGTVSKFSTNFYLSNATTFSIANENYLSSSSSWERITYLNIRISDIVPVDLDSVLLATTNGLYIYNGELIRPVNHSFDGFKGRILDIDYNKEYNLLSLATKGRGVYIVKNDSIHHVTVQNGLPNMHCNTVVSQNNSIWVGTNDGLSHITFLNNELQTRSYTTNHGLTSNKINDIVINESKLYLATDFGVTFFNPNQISINSQQPALYINKVAINGKDTINQVHYKLKHKQNNIAVNFEALAYKSGKNTQYKFRLNDYEDWTKIINSPINLNSLNPGKYNLEVIAGNEDGVWTEIPTTVSFTISPPFYKTWWFVIIQILIGIAIFGFIFWLRYKVVARRNKLQSDLIAVRQQALGSQMNPHFIFNSLNSIQSFILNNKRLDSQEYLSNFSTLMRKVLNNSQQSEISLSDELEAIKLYIKLEQVRFENKFLYNIKIEPSINLCDVNIPPLLLQPFIENAIWHGLMHKPTGGILDIEFIMKNDELAVIITDNGIGRDQAKQISHKKNKTYKSLGSSITQKRMNLFNMLNQSQMRIEYVDLKDANDQAKGTKVIIYIPVINHK